MTTSSFWYEAQGSKRGRRSKPTRGVTWSSSAPALADCPCHGSQFTPDGPGINGPAIRPVAEAR